MLFPTVTFAAFFVVVYVAHLVLRPRATAWKMAMLVASYVFYGWWDWRFCALIAASTALNWTFGYGVHGATGADRRAVVAIAVVANLAILSLFKYYGFFVEAVSTGLGAATPLPTLNIILPVGISFFTFQALSYVIDIHRDEFEPRPMLDFAVYLSFFPQLVAGPIVRAGEFLPQLDTLHSKDEVDVARAGWLIARGLFKKVVIASYLAETVVDPVFASPSAASRGELLLAFYGYAVQIYADFSGYTDIAIGIALLLGFRFPANFDNPYRSLSIQDFWRRWHMTLSRWLRDYLYVPLGGNRISSLATYRNLMATMVLGGLWHGAAWTFVAWGAIHGTALSVERLVSGRAKRVDRVAGAPSVTSGRTAIVVRWAITFHVVCLAWVLFRAETFGVAAEFITQLATAPIDASFNPLAAFVVIAAIGVQVAPPDIGARAYAAFARLAPPLQSTTVGLWLFIVAGLGPQGAAPFIYFQF